jgi:predicted Zn-dependent protease
MGHEIGHVTARHTAEQMTKQQLAGLGLAIGSIASSQIAQYAGAAQQALGVLFLKFSRENESQADQLGLRYMSRANYNVNEMPAIFTMLDRESKLNTSSGQLPEWMMTHPTPAHRLEDITKQIAALPSNTGGTVDRDEYVRRTRGLVFGTDPREGYFEGSHFYHPVLRFQITFPPDWKTQNSTQAVVAVSGQQDAAIELSQAPQKSADAAAQAFLSSQGIASNGSSQGSVHGLRAVGSSFAAQTQNGNVRGSIMWVEHGGAVYQVVGYAPETKWSSYQDVVQNSLRSFEPLNDQSKINVQPQHIDVINVPRRMSIAQLAAERSAPVSPEVLAVLNGVEVDAPLESGRPIKWVTGTSLSFP